MRFCALLSVGLQTCLAASKSSSFAAAVCRKKHSATSKLLPGAPPRSGLVEQHNNLPLPEVVLCSQMAKSFDPAAKSEKRQRNDDTSSGLPSTPGWGVQLVGSSSQATALASFQQLQRTYKSLLETRQPLVIRSKVGTSGFWYRVRVVTDTRSDAERVCSGLRAAGGNCLVQRN